MRLRDLFRGQSGNERKSTISLSTSTLLPVLDASTFVHAAQDKDNDTLQRYLLAGFPPDQPDPATKLTALHVAVESGNLRAVQFLLQAGAQVNLLDTSLSTPLHIATYLSYEEIVQVLLNHGADMIKQDNTGRNSFHLAASTGNIRVLQHFLSAADPEQHIVCLPDAQHWTPLMCASASNHPAACAFLLSNGADPSAINDKGMTSLHIAAFLGSLQVIHELVPTSSDDDVLTKILDQGDSRNQTPLFYACMEGHLDVALVLLRAGADAYHLDDDDQTCLHAMLASSIILKRHIRLFYHFIEFVDFRFYQDRLGRTLLDLAYLTQLHSIIYLLILLDYKRNGEIVFNTENVDRYSFKNSNQILSLRQLCILIFKRSIIYHHHQRQLTQRDLLENALQQCFRFHLHMETSDGNDIRSELSHGQSFDDISFLQQQINKYQKNVKSIKNQEKKSKKIPTNNSSSNTNVSTNKWTSQTDLQQTHSSWSAFTNKFKTQRPLPAALPQPLLGLPPSNVFSTPIVPATTNADHPMKNLAISMMTKLDDLLDFPSLNNNHLLDEDIKMSMNTYRLSGSDMSNPL